MKSARPNVLIVTTDQQRTDSLSSYGATFTHTPNLDRLAAGGVVFDRAYCANPVCTPARASIFSGQYLTRHAAWNVGLNVPESVPMLSHYLSDIGYRTHYIGKVHFQALGGGDKSVESGHDWEALYARWHGPYYGFETVEMSLGHATYGLRGHYGLWLKDRVSARDLKSFAEASRVGTGISFGGEAYDWDLPCRYHSSVWMADRTIEFLEHRDRSRPFFLAIGFQDPHHPHCVPRDFTDRVRPEAVPLPRYQEGELDDKPPHFMAAHKGILEGSRFRGDYWIAGQGPGANFADVSETDARHGRAYYHSLITLMDREMGRILACLEQQGLTENTLIVFTTDHGELLGDHGLWMKGPFHYEELVRIPFIVRWPAAIPAGRRIQGLISQVDIVPTVLAALGEDRPAAVEGVNALPLLKAEAESARDHVIVECVDDPRKLRLKTVVTRDWKLTYYHGEEFGELYDLRADPGEVRNLWEAPGCQKEKHRLLSAIVDHMERLEPRQPRYTYA